MKRIPGLAAALLTLIVANAAVAAAATPPKADVLFTVDRILTLAHGNAESFGPGAVAVRNGRVLWVGPAAGWQGEADKLIALGAGTLMPGFIDAHGHLGFLARTVDFANVASPPVGPAENHNQLQAVLRRELLERELAAGEWLFGMGYDDSLLAERRHPDRETLDAVSTTHPIVLVHVSGHLMAANSLALELVGITAETPDPPGGVIRRRPGSQEPDGVLEETAMGRLRGKMFGGPLTRSAVDAALETYASYGVTTVQDGAASWPLYQQLVAFGKETPLMLDVTVFPQAMNADFAVPDPETFGRYQHGVKLSGVKLILDGSPQGKTAYLSRPYHKPPNGQLPGYRGYPMIPKPEVDRRVGALLTAGVPMLVHCNGDAAAELLIDAVSTHFRERPLTDHRTVMIHAQTVRDDQLDRMAMLGIIPSYFSAHTFYWGDWHRDSVLGVERASRISPTRSTVQRAMHFTVHNDAPIVPPDMLRLLWATTNRRTRSGAVLGAAEAIGVRDALRAVTTEAAYQNFEEAEKGIIAPGRQADFVLLSEDPTAVPAERLLDVAVRATIARGAVVYRAPKALSLRD